MKDLFHGDLYGPEEIRNLKKTKVDYTECKETIEYARVAAHKMTGPTNGQVLVRDHC